MATVTISREHASGGDEIAQHLCELLHYDLFDKRLIASIARDLSLAAEDIEDLDEEERQLVRFFDRPFRRSRFPFQGDSLVGPSDVAAAKEAMEAAYGDHGIGPTRRLLRAAHRRGNVVVLGRGGHAVLAGLPEVLSVRITAPPELRAARVAAAANVSAADARRIMTHHDRLMADYIRRSYGLDWADAGRYDLVMNTAQISYEGGAQLIAQAVRVCAAPREQPVAA